MGIWEYEDTESICPNEVIDEARSGGGGPLILILIIGS